MEGLSSVSADRLASRGGCRRFQEHLARVNNTKVACCEDAKQ